jgi:hypothetical protein
MSEELTFLKEFSEELKTQDKDSQAAPRFWVIQDYKWLLIPDEYAEEYRVYDTEEGGWSLASFLEYVKTEEDYEGLLEEIDLSTPDWDTVYNVVEALNNHFDSEEYSLHGVTRESFIVQDTMFLTKAEAKEHLKLNHYHYTSKAHTYAMTAWRAPKVEKLLKILENYDWDKVEEK